MNISTLLVFRRLTLVCCLTLIVTFSAFAAESDLDTGYSPTVTIASGGLVVFAVAVQTDGKSVIGGTFSSVNGQARTRIARLNLDGTLDATFSSTLAPNGTVFGLKIQPDGKILAVGNFTLVNGAAHLRIVRLNTDGTLDAGFDSTVGADNQIVSVALQSDGKILIGGDFLNFSTTARKYIARLNTDGSLDTTFIPANISSSSNAVIRVIAPLADGTIYIGGSFDSVGGASRSFIARLTATGANDTTFNPGTGADSFVESILPLASGQVMVGGSFNSFGSFATRRAVVRLSATGTVDTTFSLNTTLSATTHIAYNIVPQSGGKFLIAGSIQAFNSDGAGSGFRRGIIRVNADGTSDTAFNVNVGTNGTINSTAIQPDGKIVIAGQFLSYNNVNQAPLARLNGMPVTAAGVSVSGRVSVYGGRGLSGAYVSIQDQQGNERSVVTGVRGVFCFDEVESGQTYILTVRSRRFQFESRVISVTDDLTDVDFIWSNGGGYEGATDSITPTKTTRGLKSLLEERRKVGLDSERPLL